jgi:2-polyprenyl-3-methyl-5-hydroxy-6-metoxy-1,4-benzoquinol methylase
MDSGHGHHGHHHHGQGHERHGAKQPERFDPARAALLDDPGRLEYMPPARLFELLDAPRGGVVVDFGTGTGAFAIPLAKERPDLTVLALDEQPEMLKMLRAKPAAAALSNLKPVLNEEARPYAGKADRILAINVLHELGDEAMKEMVGLMKPDGAILFVDWNSDVERPVGPPREHTYGIAEAVRRVESFGLRAETLAPLPYHYVIRARRA